MRSVIFSQTDMANRASSSLDKTADGQSPTSTVSWSWSIRPLVIWIRILGVDLPDISNSLTRRYQWRLWIYGVICLFSHAIGELDIIYFLHYKSRASFERAGGVNYGTTTATWNTIIDFTNYAVHALGIHTVLVTVIRTRWIDLTEIFHRSSLVFTDENYVRLRRMSFFGVVYVILLISGLMTTAMGYHLTMGTCFGHRLFISFMSIVSIIYPMTTLLTFAIHCYASSLAFELITSPIKIPEIQLDWVKSMEKRHIWACETVDGINHCFGWMLFLSTTFFFVAIINATFYLVGLDNPNITLLDIVFFLFALVHFILMCFAADCIQIKAQLAVKELLKLKCNEPSKELRAEMGYLVSDMAQTIPGLSANGYFNVSKKLLPQVTGTTLSYLFILYQFEASETKPSD